MKRTAGISLMLLIFLSLCLITFSLLSLSGATADEKLSQKAANRTTVYYEAVTAANEILDEIDTQLAAALKEAADSQNPEETYLAACAEISVSGTEFTWTAADADNSSSTDDDTGSTDNTDSGIDDADSTDNTDSGIDDADSTDNTNSGTISYDVTMTDDQHLHIVLSICWPEESSDTLYRITCWKVVSTQEWTRDTSQNLYRSSEEDIS
ncbi:MAG: hypothetical protein LUD18_11475 [Lachnospiraceae bacterium]|nr:hypothetical protein [Lachnospiraceae bacterium]